MPATSEKQLHTARMALAYKHGKPIKDFPIGARAAIKSMAEMGEEKLKDYTDKSKLGLLARHR